MLRLTGESVVRADHLVFLLSPARTDGKRAQQLLRPEAGTKLARQLRSPGGAPLGEVFSFTSELYFRGKLTYARSFARPPSGCPGVLVITAGQGLVAPETHVGAADLQDMANVAIAADTARFREPLTADTQTLAARLGSTGRVVLLGSIASDKYVAPLGRILGDQLYFPRQFVGRGDMSRGGLLLRHAEAAIELNYIRLAGAARRGPRPPRLDESPAVPPKS